MSMFIVVTVFRSFRLPGFFAHDPTRQLMSITSADAATPVDDV